MFSLGEVFISHADEEEKINEREDVEEKLQKVNNLEEDSEVLFDSISEQQEIFTRILRIRKEPKKILIGAWFPSLDSDKKTDDDSIAKTEEYTATVLAKVESTVEVQDKEECSHKVKSLISQADSELGTENKPSSLP